MIISHKEIVEEKCAYNVRQITVNTHQEKVVYKQTKLCIWHDLNNELNLEMLFNIATMSASFFFTNIQYMIETVTWLCP